MRPLSLHCSDPHLSWFLHITFTSGHILANPQTLHTVSTYVNSHGTAAYYFAPSFAPELAAHFTSDASDCTASPHATTNCSRNDITYLSTTNTCPHLIARTIVHRDRDIFRPSFCRAVSGGGCGCWKHPHCGCVLYEPRVVVLPPERPRGILQLHHCDRGSDSTCVHSDP